MKEALRAILLADTEGVAAQVGDGVRWQVRPQGSPVPSIVLRRFGGGPAAAMDGPVNLDDPMVMVDCFGRTEIEADTLARAVKALLHARRIVHAGDQLTCFVEAERETYDAMTAAPDKLFITSLDLRVWHSSV